MGSSGDGVVPGTCNDPHKSRGYVTRPPICVNLFSETGGGPNTMPFTNDIHFNGDIQKNNGTTFAGENWSASMDDASVMVHEMGHALNGFNYHSQFVPGDSEPMNVSHSENLYRAWVGSPVRNDYGVLSQGGQSLPIPNRSILEGLQNAY